MHNLNNLHIYSLARENIKHIGTIASSFNGFGDLRNQAERAAISVVSNIAEGAGYDSNKQFHKFLGYARGSNFELQAQLHILIDLGCLGRETRPEKFEVRC